jgi:ankyrin repeat protein
LDETYKHVLREIKKPNQDHARRLLQCLVVAIWPLHVGELAEVVAVDFDNAEGIPKLKPSWRWEDQEQALLMSCSSLITIVGKGCSQVVQFSHFSVKEFLTSACLSTSSQDISCYHIILGPAHAILAEVCLSIFLDNLINHSTIKEHSPLAEYATEHWVHHAQFEDVVSHIKGIQYLFDLDKPYFAAWCQLHDIDTRPSHGSVFFQFRPNSKSATTPLYYVALCGFSKLVEHVNAIGGWYMTPAVATLAGRHFELAQVLHCNGSSLEPQGDRGFSPLHSAAYEGDLEMVQVLLDYGVDINAQSNLGSTPLLMASWDYFNDPDLRVVWLLLDHGADPNIRPREGEAPLHRASQDGKIEMARLLV